MGLLNEDLSCLSLNEIFKLYFTDLVEILLQKSYMFSFYLVLDNYPILISFYQQSLLSMNYFPHGTNYFVVYYYWIEWLNTVKLNIGLDLNIGT